MNISTLCDQIELQPEIKDRVLAFVQDFDFETVEKLFKSFLVYEKMDKALSELKAVLGEDGDHTKNPCLYAESVCRCI